MEVILFVIQDANFASKCVYVPMKQFLNVRREDYQKLKRNVRKIGNINLITRNYYQDGKNGNRCCYASECDTILNLIEMFIDWYDDKKFGGKQDRRWMNLSIIPSSEFMFNHIKNYEHLCKSTENIKVMDSFLVLERINGEYQISTIETSAELYESILN
jgi:hypothetical protein